MKRPSPDILIFLTQGAVFLTDTAGKTDRVARSAGQSALQALDAALGPTLKGKAVLLFWEEAWCQTVEMSAAQFTGLSEKEQTAALGFEAEAFSGLPPDQAFCAWTSQQALGGNVSCVVLQVAKSEMRSATETFKRHRVKLLGVSHPLFLGVAAVTEEAVPQLAARFRGMASLPFIPPTQEPPSASRALVIGLMFAAVLGVVCWQVDARLRREVRRLGGIDRTLSEMNRESAQLNQQIQSITKETKAQEDGFAAYREKQLKMKQARSAIAFLFDAVAQSCPESVMVRSLKSEGPFGLGIEGLSGDPHGVDTFFVACGKSIMTRGWTLQPEEVSAKQETGRGGPWRFACKLLPPGILAEPRKIVPPEDVE